MDLISGMQSWINVSENQWIYQINRINNKSHMIISIGKEKNIKKKTNMPPW